MAGTGTLPTPDQIAERVGARKPAEPKATEATKEPAAKTEPAKAQAEAKKPEPAKPAPKAEPAKTEPVKEIQFSVENFNKAYGTQFKSDDEVKAVLENDKQFREIKPKYEDLDKKYKELELQAKINPFADDEVKTYNDLKKNGATREQLNAFVKVQSADLDKLDVKEKAILQYQLKEGLSAEKARLAFADDYAIDPKDYDNVDMEDEAAVAKMKKQIEKETRRLERDAKGIDSFLSEYKKKVSTVEKPEDTFKKEWSKYEPQVKEIAPAIADNYQGLKGIPLEAVKDGEPTTFDFEVPDDFKKAVPSLVQSFLAQRFAEGRPVPMTKEGIAQINEHLDGVLIQHSFRKYILDSNIDTASRIREEMANKFSNSGKLNKGDIREPEGEAQTNLDKYKQKMLNRY